MAFLTRGGIAHNPFFLRAARDPFFLRFGLEGLAIALRHGWRPDAPKPMIEVIAEALEEHHEDE